MIKSDRPWTIQALNNLLSIVSAHYDSVHETIYHIGSPPTLYILVRGTETQQSIAYWHGRGQGYRFIQDFTSGGVSKNQGIRPPFPFPPLPSPALPSLSLEVGPLNSAGGSGGVL